MAIYIQVYKKQNMLSCVNTSKETFSWKNSTDNKDNLKGVYWQAIQKNKGWLY